jgi:tetratricopeptide (TPR) repeat protein
MRMARHEKNNIIPVAGTPICARLPRIALAAGAVILSACMAACSDSGLRVREATELYYSGQYRQAAAVMAPLIKKPNRDFVLNNCRYGSCALAAGNLNHAQQAFLTAYRIMNSVNVNTGSRVLGAVVLYDGLKVWKGQPFERAMAHYYLGLIFLIKGEYQNARAAFQNSLFRLRKYSNPNVSMPPAQRFARTDSNFTLGYFGLGLCYLKLGHPHLARANFERAQSLDPDLAPVIAKIDDPRTNALIFVDYGHGPRRRPAGMYGQQTVFTPAPWQVGPPPPLIVWDNQHRVRGVQQSAMANLLALAQEKRWLTMDTIREAKAVVGTGLMAGGLAASEYGAYNRDQTVALAGLGASLLGAAIAASSQADTRYWQMLPRTVYVAPFHLRKGPNVIRVEAGPQISAPISLNYTPSSAYRVFYVRLP